MKKISAFHRIRSVVQSLQGSNRALYVSVILFLAFAIASAGSGSILARAWPDCAIKEVLGAPCSGYCDNCPNGQAQCDDCCKKVCTGPALTQCLACCVPGSGC